MFSHWLWCCWMDWTDSWKLQPLDLELQSFYLFYLKRIISLFTRRGQENMKPRALAMLRSSSSSVLFFLLILYFFLLRLPLSHLLHGFVYRVRNNLSSTELLKRTPIQCVLLLHSASKQPFLGVFLFSFWWGYRGGGRMGGQGQGGGFVFLCFIEVRGWQGLWNVMQSCWNAAQKQMCNKLAKGEGTALGWLIPREQYPTPGTGGELKDHRATAGTIHTCFTLIFLLFPSQNYFPGIACWERSCYTGGTCFKAGWGRGGLGRAYWCFRVGGVGFVQRGRHRWLVVGCLPVCMCTYAHIHLVVPVHLIHTHVYMPIRTARMVYLKAPWWEWAYV